MKAIVVHQFGPPDVMKYEEIPTPEPGEGEVLVRVGAVSVNRGFDVNARAGNSAHGATLPLIMGVDPSGAITAVGPEVSASRVGEHVNIRGMARCGTCGNCELGKRCSLSRPIGITAPGGYAEYIVVPDFQARKIPGNIPFADATVICRHASAAFSEIHTSGLRQGEWALVMGAAGALASFVVQFAKLRGAHVIAAAGGEDRLEAARALGADYTVNYRTQDLEAEVRRITGKRGVDVVFENIGDPTIWPGAWDSLAMNGRLVTVGFHGGGYRASGFEETAHAAIEGIVLGHGYGIEGRTWRLPATCSRGENTPAHRQEAAVGGCRHGTSPGGEQRGCRESDSRTLTPSNSHNSRIFQALAFGSMMIPSLGGK